jgi:ABC-type nitrate/sulfonate/bicarbonate transport system permease component
MAEQMHELGRARTETGAREALSADGVTSGRAQATGGDSRWRARAETVLPPALFMLGLGLLWEIIVVVRNISPIILPKPSAIFQELFDNAGYYAWNGGVTFYEAVAGFITGALVAIVLAAIMARSRGIERTVFPLIVLRRPLS